MIECRWALRAEAGHYLRCLRTCAASVRGPYSDYVGIVTRGADSGISARARPFVLAHVASGDDYYDTRSPCGFHSLAQRIELVTFIDPTGQGQVYDSNVVGILEIDGLLDGSNHRAVCACTGGIQHAKVDDFC